jgi:hypothetical protein
MAADSSPASAPRWETACLLAILALGLGLRLYGLAWGCPADLHCDEVSTLGNAASLARHLAAGGLPAADRSNYGNLPYYLLLLVTAPLGALLRLIGSPLDQSALYLLTGRALSAVADTAGIYLVYLMGRRLWAGVAALLGAGLYAVTLLSVREAHFATVDSLGICIGLLLIWLSLRAAERPGWRSFLGCGVGLGLALSVRISALLLAPVPLLVWGLWAAKQDRDRPARPWSARVVMAALFLAALVTLGLSEQVHRRLAQLAQHHLTTHAADLAATGHNLLFWQSQAQAMVNGALGLVRNLSLLLGLLAAVGLVYSFRGRGPRVASALWRRLGQPLAILGMGLGLFALLNPAGVLQPRAYWLPGARDSALSALLIVGGANRGLPFAFTFQFVDTRPFLYQLQHVYPYAFGWPLMLVALLATVYWTVRLLWGRAGLAWVPLVALLLLLLSMSTSWIKMVRYVLPQLPLFTLLAGGFLAILLQARPRWVRGMGVVLAAGAGLSALLWCVAYLSLYAQSDSRLQALAWVQQHARPGSHILVEEDDAWGAAGLALWQRLRQYEVRVYDPHYLEHDYYGRALPPEVRRAKEEYLAENFTWAHYVVLTGLRRERMQPVADWFPVMFPFYALLFTGRADLAPAASFTPEPHLGGWILPDRGSEPTFRLFDHPNVYVFQRRLPPSR